MLRWWWCGVGVCTGYGVVLIGYRVVWIGYEGF
jgi:hypothetical protein